MNRRDSWPVVFVALVALLLSTATARAQAPAPAAPWEPTQDNVSARAAEIEAWQAQILGKEPTKETRAQLRSELIDYAKKAEAPKWISKGAWKETKGEAQLWLAVGTVSGIKNHQLALTTAENRARAEIAKMLSVTVTVSEKKGSRSVKSFSSVTLTGVTLIDWYVSSDNHVYALATKYWPNGPQ